MTETDDAAKYLTAMVNTCQTQPRIRGALLDFHRGRYGAASDGNRSGDVAATSWVVIEVEECDFGEDPTVIDGIRRGEDAVVGCIDDLRSVRYAESFSDDQDGVVYGANGPLIEGGLVGRGSYRGTRKYWLIS